MKTLFKSIFILALFCYPSWVASQVSITIPDTEFTPGDTIGIPLNLEQTGDNGLYAIELTVQYDTGHLSFTGAETASTVSDSLSRAINETGEGIIFSVASIHGINDSGNLVILNFTSEIESRSDISISRQILNENDAEFDLTSASVSTIQTPFVLNQIADQILPEDFPMFLAAKFDTVFADVQPGTLSYNILGNTAPVIADVIGDSLILASYPDSSGFGSLIVEAMDTDGNTATDTLSVTVLPVNDVPEILELPDTLRLQTQDTLYIPMDSAFYDIEDEFGDLDIEVSINPMIFLIQGLF